MEISIASVGGRAGEVIRYFLDDYYLLLSINPARYLNRFPILATIFCYPFFGQRILGSNNMAIKRACRPERQQRHMRPFRYGITERG